MIGQEGRKGMEQPTITKITDRKEAVLLIEPLCKEIRDKPAPFEDEDALLLITLWLLEKTEAECHIVRVGDQVAAFLLLRRMNDAPPPGQNDPWEAIYLYVGRKWRKKHYGSRLLLECGRDELNGNVADANEPSVHMLQSLGWALQPAPLTKPILSAFVMIRGYCPELSSFPRMLTGRYAKKK